MSRPVPVLIVDDQAPCRRAARVVLAATSGFEAVGEAQSGGEALERVASLAPALVLMDINMPGIGGIEASRHIADSHPGTVVLLLSTYRAEDVPAEARTFGAAGYIHKEEFGPRCCVTCGNATGGLPDPNDRACWVSADRRSARSRTRAFRVPAPSRCRASHRWRRHDRSC